MTVMANNGTIVSVTIFYKVLSRSVKDIDKGELFLDSTLADRSEQISIVTTLSVIAL